MPIFFYLPLIVWTGLIEVAMDATQDRDQQNAQRDPADLMMDGASIIPFPMTALGCVID